MSGSATQRTTLTDMIVFAVLLLVLAVFTTLVGVLAWRMKLPGNGVVGIRVPEVRKSQELWDTAHRIAGPLWTLAGGSLALGGIVAFTAAGWMWLVVGLAIVGWLAFLGIGAGMAAHTVALLDARASKQAEQGCCSSQSSPKTDTVADPAADCGVSGGCGACSLNGACEGGAAALSKVDVEAARRAAAASDS